MLIYILGIDGSGKTTHASSLCKKFLNQGISCINIRPRNDLMKLLPSFVQNWIDKRPQISPRNITIPTHYKISKNIIMKFPISLLLLIYAYLSYILIIRPALKKNSIVICDRFFYDWLFNIWGVNSQVLAILLKKPDISILLDVPVNLAFTRMHDDYDKNISFEYYESLRKYYLILAIKYNFLKINNNDDFIKVSMDIYNYILATYKG
jgi:thymidylate kinase